MAKPRLLWFKARMPKAVCDGSSVVTLNLADCLSEVFDIDLVALRLRGNEDSLADSLCPPFRSVRLVTPDNAGSWLRRSAFRVAYEARSRSSGIPRAAFYESCGAVRRVMAELLRRGDYNLLHVEYWTASPLLSLPVRTPRIVYFHDAAFHTLEQLAAAETAPAAARSLFRQARQLETYERLAAREATAAFFVADEDRVLLQGAGARRSVHIPVLLRGRLPPSPVTCQSPHVLFLGRFEHLPNVQAAEWLVKHVVPRVRAKCDAVKFRIAGPGLTPKMQRRFAVPNVETLGWIDDLDALYADTAVSLAPLQAGTGVSIKVLEALARGVPMVATHIGARGTPAGLGGAVIADEPQSFAEAIVHLLQHPDLRQQVGQRARDLVWQHHCSPQVIERVQQAFLSVIAAEPCVVG